MSILRPLEAEVEEVALSSSALRSFAGVKLIGFGPSRLFSAGGCVELLVLVAAVVLLEVEVEVVEDDKRNKFGAWLEELAESD